MAELDEKFMREALREAKAAEAEDEIPIGAVIVFAGRVIAKGHNMTERLHDPTAHAEMIAITAATEAMGGKYLNDCMLYVTVEPCPMCAAASAWAQVGRIVYGASDPKRGYSLFIPRLKSCLASSRKSAEEWLRNFSETKGNILWKNRMLSETITR